MSDKKTTMLDLAGGIDTVAKDYLGNDRIMRRYRQILMEQ